MNNYVTWNVLEQHSIVTKTHLVEQSNLYDDVHPIHYQGLQKLK